MEYVGWHEIGFRSNDSPHVDCRTRIDRYSRFSLALVDFGLKVLLNVKVDVIAWKPARERSYMRWLSATRARTAASIPLISSAVSTGFGQIVRIFKRISPIQPSDVRADMCADADGIFPYNWIRTVILLAVPPRQFLLIIQYLNITRSSFTAEIARVGGRYAVQGH